MEKRCSASRSCTSAGRLQKPEQVGDGRAVLARSSPDLFVTQVHLAGEALQRLSRFDRVQVLALDVFNQRDFEELLVGIVLDYGGHLAEFGHLRSSEPPLTGNQLESIAFPPQNQWLDDSVRPNGGSQFFQPVVIEDGAGLEGVGVDQIDTYGR